MRDSFFLKDVPVGESGGKACKSKAMLHMDWHHHKVAGVNLCECTLNMWGRSCWRLTEATLQWGDHIYNQYIHPSQPTHLPIYLYIYLLVYMYTYLPIYPNLCIQPSIYLLIHLHQSIFPSIHASSLASHLMPLSTWVTSPFWPRSITTFELLNPLFAIAEWWANLLQAKHLATTSHRRSPEKKIGNK